MRIFKASWKKLQETMFTMQAILMSCQICLKKFWLKLVVSKPSAFISESLICLFAFSSVVINTTILLLFSGVDGGFSRWSFWSECNLTCGGGNQRRTRTCTYPPPQGYGEDCNGALLETRTCNEAPCPEGEN